MKTHCDTVFGHQKKKLFAVIIIRRYFPVKTFS